jgi:hypothetical protein
VRKNDDIDREELTFFGPSHMRINPTICIAAMKYNEGFDRKISN